MSQVASVGSPQSFWPSTTTAQGGTYAHRRIWRRWGRPVQVSGSVCAPVVARRPLFWYDLCFLSKRQSKCCHGDGWFERLQALGSRRFLKQHGSWRRGAGHLLEKSNYLTRGCEKRTCLPCFPVARIVDSSFEPALLQLLLCQAERRAQQRVWLGRKIKSPWGARTCA
jgi:hypothetical protein